MDLIGKSGNMKNPGLWEAWVKDEKEREKFVIIWWSQAEHVGECCLFMSFPREELLSDVIIVLNGDG